jgi:energy-coupling factor transporter transmembrane protein EcfT
MSANDEDRIKQLLKLAVPPVAHGAEPARDLWPAVLKRLDEGEARESAANSRWMWFDAALLAGLAIMAVSVPATVPLLLYYL